MGKKSQFYMFATLILLGLVFAIVSNRSSVRTGKVSNTQNYLNNYKYEAGVVMNNAIYHKKNISEELRNFTDYFISYANERGTELGIVYLYSYDNQLFIGNHLTDQITFADTGAVLDPDDEYSTDFDSDVSLNYNSESYRFFFSEDRAVELKTLVVQNE